MLENLKEKWWAQNPEKVSCEDDDSNSSGGISIYNIGGVFIVILVGIGKKHALNKYDHFTLNTSCFWESTRSNITPIVQFHEIFVTKIMN